jgi:integrase
MACATHLACMSRSACMPCGTAASLLKDLGVPARDAQIILGHAHITTTQQIYTHVDEATRRGCGQEWWTAARFALRA